jgi:hypothetical protein
MYRLRISIYVAVLSSLEYAPALLDLHLWVKLDA